MRAGRTLTLVTIAPARQTSVLRLLSAAGSAPAGAVSARVTLTLATSLTNYDGTNAPTVG